MSHPTSYWVPRHSPRVFTPKVDLVAGVGWDSAAKAGPAATRYMRLRRVVSNLASFDWDPGSHRMRLLSVHPGVTVDEVVAATGFDLVIGADVPDDPRADSGRAAPDQGGHRPARRALPGGAVRDRHGNPSRADDPRHRAVRHRVPRSSQTGMGYVSDARLTAATSAAGGLGIIGSALMSYEELCRGHR